MTEQTYVATTDTQRDEKRQAFIEATQGYGGGWQDAIQTAKGADAGSRRYVHLTHRDGRRAYVMDSPYAFLKQKEFCLIGKVLRDIGVHTPEIYDTDMQQGFALIEDIEGDLYADLFDAGADKEPYIMAAMDVLIHIHKHLDIKQFDGQLSDAMQWFNIELPSFVDWYYPAYHGYETPPDVVAEYQAIWQDLLAKLPDCGLTTLVMIDYHAPNLIWAKSGEGIDKVGVIDFQDGVLTSPAYDVMSLLEDDRRFLKPEIRERALKYYLHEMHDLIDEEAFLTAMAILSAQRHTKNMGNFLRIVTQKGADVFLDYLPKCIHWNHQALQHPAVAPMQKFMMRHCPNYTEPMQPESIRRFKQAIKTA